MIIAFVNQKGGVGKSALARAMAVEFVRNQWPTHTADMDRTQMTNFKWAERRKENEIDPAIEVAIYSEPKTALKAAESTDVLIIDGKAFADKHALEIATHSDLIVIPVGVSLDDLEPSLALAVEFVNKGVARERIIFVVSKVQDGAEKEAMNTRNSIKAWGFDVATGWISQKAAYSQAMDRGFAMTESKFKTLNEKVDKIVEQLFNKVMSLQEKVEEAL
jgi:chromosome partitioning protein